MAVRIGLRRILTRGERGYFLGHEEDLATWTDLDLELDAWKNGGRAATLWWRDDDAVEPTPALERLLALSSEFDIPVAIAVIPAEARPALERRLAAHPACAVLQHGYSHANHAPGDRKKAEFGPHREVDAMLEELSRGRDALVGAGFAAVLPALAPPWNRIDPDLAARLPEVGLDAVSTFGPRPDRRPAPGLAQTNTHVDPVAWHQGRGFMGTAATLDQLTGHLAARRQGEADADEATGLLTHHLVVDDAGWQFLEDLFDHTRHHPAAAWVTPAEALAA